jgi:predicted  nucleic acid-binding Zn-ribbon protein
MSQAEQLYQLQEIDLGILRSQQRLQAIAAQLSENQALQAAQARVESMQKQLSPLQARARNLDLEMRSTIEKAQNTENNLYSGSIKNPKELQDMQHEIEALRRRRSELETQLLETMFVVEETESALAEAQAELESARQTWKKTHLELLDEQAKLESRLSQLQTRRQQTLVTIKPESLKIYEGLRLRKQQQPVALMQNSTCAMCGVGQNMAIERAVRQAQTLVYCTNCGRILVSRS